MSHTFICYGEDHRFEYHQFVCDGENCDKQFGNQGAFQDVWREAKGQGWVCRKDQAGNWCHFCPNCKEDYR